MIHLSQAEATLIAGLLGATTGLIGAFLGSLAAPAMTQRQIRKREREHEVWRRWLDDHLDAWRLSCQIVEVTVLSTGELSDRERIDFEQWRGQLWAKVGPFVGMRKIFLPLKAFLAQIDRLRAHQGDLDYRRTYKVDEQILDAWIELLCALEGFHDYPSVTRTDLIEHRDEILRALGYQDNSHLEDPQSSGAVAE